ncbi:BRO1-domain-containing protein [Hysterangium stoloniferum]|nr:BRO1-domain-containing protein [Hysterangium stoloniferum]
MPNLLTLPFKSTSAIPLRSALREYIQSAHPETHPDAFKWDINKWENMRKEAVSNAVHVDTVDKALAYQAQLVFILTKIPANVNLPIPYSRAFPLNSALSPLSLNNLAYERANVLYNLGALYCNLATSEDRSNAEGIKRALAHFQNAAGVFSHMLSSALPALESSLLPDTPMPGDLSAPFIKSFQLLMISQAQECFWQRATLGTTGNLLVAKLSAKTSSLYRETAEAVESDSTTSALFPRDWLAHVRMKFHHFASAALFRKSMEDLEASRYGIELARLDMARSEAKKAMEIGRRGGIARAVQNDTKSLFENLETSYNRAERDNDLIYHQVVPSASSIPSIPEIKDVVFCIIPPGLQDPKGVTGEGNVILGELSGWGVRVAVDVYQQRKKDWVQLEIMDRAKHLNVEASRALQSLNLPATLDALDRPIGLPPSLLGKAEEVRLEDGMNRIPALIEDVRRLSRRNLNNIDEALDILDQEATEDEEMRTAYSVDVWTRPTSYEANQELTDQAARYREILDKAMESDRELQENWERWAPNIAALCWEESELEKYVPSSTVNATPGGGARSTQGHARALRAHLESLDDLVHARSELVQRVQRISETDNVTPRFMREASAHARWVEVRPDVFEQAIEEELGKYDRYRTELEESERRQEEALNGIRERNTAFLESRREDPSIKAREVALQALDLAYHQYCDIRKDLKEGIKFYNDLATLIAEMKETFKAWVLHRRKDVEDAPPSEHMRAPQLGQANRFPQPSSHPQAQYEYETIPSQSQPWSHPQSQSQPRPHTVESQPPPQSPPPPLSFEDDFAANLPSPTSSAWQSMSTAPTTTRKKNRNMAH